MFYADNQYGQFDQFQLFTNFKSTSVFDVLLPNCQYMPIDLCHDSFEGILKDFLSKHMFMSVLKIVQKDLKKNKLSFNLANCTKQFKLWFQDFPFYEEMVKFSINSKKFTLYGKGISVMELFCKFDLLFHQVTTSSKTTFSFSQLFSPTLIVVYYSLRELALLSFQQEIDCEDLV